MDGVPVQLWLYDLSNGLVNHLARILCPQSKIDGIWHSSIVVYDREIWFGSGITTAVPGTCHLGLPHQVMALGTTYIDEETLEEFLEEVKDYYTHERYHLLGFNYLPIDFVSTNLGWLASPLIQALYRKTSECVSSSTASIRPVEDEEQGGVVASVEPTSSVPDERYFATFGRLALKSLGIILPSSLSVVGLARKEAHKVTDHEQTDPATV
ncbi:SubName: Full=Uncharacterized protein {ECO:0000313/EMBL:CCA70386.1} [Serendipita indica DSM 11827]|uniref:PPPDE domain-containing protein n=1 Tax=Serendipita indica (strain DSM 11827) TaxID=1109443 RepID=G4TGE3_SERID|nr:SubName: Full=Uncharacterized protein {ECO:0000313/EMBL:CCA70386.1} [Serendipita indica DSM 11827]CCA70386.1 hypothetical protein PIIN_04325 [Serendipita indica DSM 11827]